MLALQVLLTDGNGLLHPRAFGVACHIGVAADVPVIGVAKTMLNLDSLTKAGVARAARRVLAKAGEWFELRGASGRVWGACVLSRDSAAAAMQRAAIRSDKRRPAATRTEQGPARGHVDGVEEGVCWMEGCKSGAGKAGGGLQMLQVHAPDMLEPQQPQEEAEEGAEEEGEVCEQRQVAGLGQHVRVGQTQASGGEAGAAGGGNPVFVSVGHRISLRTAVAVVGATCIAARVPEPIRQADLR